MDEKKHIKRLFSFEREIERTEFYSGLLAFVPSSVKISKEQLLEEIRKIYTDGNNSEFYSEDEYELFHFENY